LKTEASTDRGHRDKSVGPTFRTWLLEAIAWVTRRVRPRGTERLLRLVHPLGTSLTTVAPLGSGLKVHVDTRKPYERNVFFYGAIEPRVQYELRRLLKSGQAAIDVGANIGVHTLSMARLAYPASVLAAEPNPSVCVRLTANLALNSVTNVIVRQVALSNEEGLRTLYLPADSSIQACASLQPNDRFLHDRTSIQVRTMTVDALVAATKLRDVGLIKIDVEGIEPRVLAGAANLLRRDRPALIFEFTRDWWSAAGYQFEDVCAQLREYGYTAFCDLDNRGDPIRQPLPNFMNVLAR
jgi:FkbM family methyltransferase